MEKNYRDKLFEDARKAAKEREVENSRIPEFGRRFLANSDDYARALGLIPGDIQRIVAIRSKAGIGQHELAKIQVEGVEVTLDLREIKPILYFGLPGKWWQKGILGLLFNTDRTIAIQAYIRYDADGTKQDMIWKPFVAVLRDGWHQKLLQAIRANQPNLS